MPFNDFVVIITSHYYFNNSEEAVQFNKRAIDRGPFFSPLFVTFVHVSPAEETLVVPCYDGVSVWEKGCCF